MRINLSYNIKLINGCFDVSRVEFKRKQRNKPIFAVILRSNVLQNTLNI